MSGMKTSPEEVVLESEKERQQRMAGFGVTRSARECETLLRILVQPQ